jgi:hypothetical protein
MPRRVGIANRNACLEVRTGTGLGVKSAELADPELLGRAVTQLRFASVPAIGLFDSAAPFLRVDHEALPIAGVLGGALLTNFAVEFHDESGELPASVSFHREYPGSERLLAGQGRAFVRIQYPGRLLGRESTDRCEIEGEIGCEDENALIQGGLWADPVAMVVDACLSPPPCTVTYDERLPSEDRCSLHKGRNPLSPLCDSGTKGEKNLSLLIGTGVPGLILFSDSAEEIFGDTNDLPECDSTAGLGEAPLACRRRGTSTLPVPGWGTVQVTKRLRVRSIGLVAGLRAAIGDSPCHRLDLRLAGLERQCEQLDQKGRPERPAAASIQEEVERNYADGSVWLGEALLPEIVDENRAGAWIDTSIVDRETLWATSLRRLAGSDAVQPDGVLGSALLSGTNTILDTTESDERPGLRIRCLENGGTSCLALPACGGDSAAERASCCYGLPQELLMSVIARDATNGSSPAEPCCAALSPENRVLLQAQQIACSSF